MTDTYQEIDSVSTGEDRVLVTVSKKVGDNVYRTETRKFDVLCQGSTLRGIDYMSEAACRRKYPSLFMK